MPGQGNDRVRNQQQQGVGCVLQYLVDNNVDDGPIGLEYIAA
jgi:hypothetical protein